MAAPVLLLLAELLDDDGELAEPHPAASTKVALATAMVMIDFLNCYLLDEGSVMLPHGRRLTLTAQPARAGRLPPTGLPEG